MSEFTPNEISYLQSQRLGRLATIGQSGELHVVPVRYHYNAELDTIDVTGRFLGQSKKYRDVQDDARVAFVVDDVEGPGKPRGVEVRGQGQAIADGGDRITPGADPEFIRVTPTRILSWGIDTEPTKPNSRRVGRR